MTLLRRFLTVFRSRHESRELSHQLKEARIRLQDASDDVKRSALLTRDSSDAIYETIRATLERMEKKSEPHRSHPA